MNVRLTLFVLMNFIKLSSTLGLLIVRVVGCSEYYDHYSGNIYWAHLPCN